MPRREECAIRVLPPRGAMECNASFGRSVRAPFAAPLFWYAKQAPTRLSHYIIGCRESTKDFRKMLRRADLRRFSYVMPLTFPPAIKRRLPRSGFRARPPAGSQAARGAEGGVPLSIVPPALTQPARPKYSFPWIDASKPHGAAPRRPFPTRRPISGGTAGAWPPVPCGSAAG